VKTLNFVFDKYTVTKNWDFTLAHFLILVNGFLGVGTPHRCVAKFPGWKGVIHGLMGLAPSSQIEGSLLKAFDRQKHRPLKL
jgi:hypothetical protein